MMTAKAASLWILAASFCAAFCAKAQDGPSFCEAVPEALLSGVAAPYSSQLSPDGSTYCEGVLRKPIALQAPHVISIKQDQPKPPKFVPGQLTSITWCDDAKASIHVRLRSMNIPFFALDGEHPGQFEWRTDLISGLQPDWTNLAALGNKQVTIAGHLYDVIVPLRIGPGYSDLYSFAVQANHAVSMKQVLIEPVDPVSKTLLLAVTFSAGPNGDTWITTIPFIGMRRGIYRITFEGSSHNLGAMTEPVYLLHETCVIR